MNSTRVRIGTLFSGIGAPEQALQRLYPDSYEIVFACEWDKFARQSYKANYEIADEHFHRDINDMDGTQYKGKVDVIVGGSPCQDFSIAGLRAGIDGHRGQLIWQYYRIIKEIMPPVFIYENVKGMVSDKNGKTLADFLEVFRNLGYGCHAEVVNTKDYGVPQNRERIYIVGFLDYMQYFNFEFAEKQPLKKRLKDMLEDNVDEKYYLSKKIVSCLLRHKEVHKEKGNGFSFNPKATSEIDTANCITTKYGNRASDTYIKVIGTLNIKGKEQIKRVYSTDGVAPTLTTMQGGGQEPKIEAECKIRKLTPRECLRLQGFSDSFKQVVSDTQIYKQAGNSMSVNILEMIFKQIEKAKQNKNSLLGAIA